MGLRKASYLAGYGRHHRGYSKDEILEQAYVARDPQSWHLSRMARGNKTLLKNPMVPSRPGPKGSGHLGNSIFKILNL